MPLSPENQRKIIIILTTLILLAGAGFMIFAIFFNHAQVQITLESPFSVTIKNLRTQSCLENPCKITLAPGQYNLEINKEGYLPFLETATLTLWNSISIQPSLRLEPTLKPLGDWSTQTVSISNQSPQFIISDQTVGKQPALFAKENPNQPLIYFLRNITKYQLISDRSAKQIGLLDQSDQNNASLYLIDLVNKTRKIITEGALLDFEWVESPTDSQPTNFFLLLKRNFETLNQEVYLGTLGNSQSADLEILPLRNDLQTIVPISTDQIVFTQPFSLDSSTGFTIQKLNLKTQENQTVFAIDNLSLPSRLEYDSGNRTIYLESDKTAYSLSPISF